MSNPGTTHALAGSADVAPQIGPRIDFENYAPSAQPRPEHAFRGRRVKGPGGIVRFILDEPAGEPKYAIKAPETDATDQHWHVTGVLCDCGCLLRDPDELCPACVVPWCRAQEVAWARSRVVYYRPIRQKKAA